MISNGIGRDLPSSVAVAGPCGPEELAPRLEALPDGARVIAVFLEIDGRAQAGGAAEVAASFACPSILAVRGQGILPGELNDAFDLCFITPNISILDDGSELTAEKAAERGLVNSVIQGEELFRTAVGTTESISELAPNALEACKRAVREGAGLELEEGLSLEIALFAELFATRDMREGTSAFLEKRSPFFRGE